MFFSSSQSLTFDEQDDQEGQWIRARSRLECPKALDKIRSQQKMCMAFIIHEE
jgi:hypothetical protein